MTERARDYSFEALAEVTGTSFSAGRGELNAALKSLREQAEIDDDFLLAAEIHERAKMYRRAMPGVMLTPTALAKHWQRVFEEANRKPAASSNRAAPVSECKTCAGDRFVVVATRLPQQTPWMKARGIVPTTEPLEEYAPCPDCNSGADTSFRRFDNTHSMTMDPAKSRELMQR